MYYLNLMAEVLVVSANHQVWFAFVPLLSLIQWFQMGRVSAFNILWLFLPVVGWFILFPYKWIRATINISERGGERGSYCILFLLPVVKTAALIRLSLKRGFWVKTSTEAKVIEKIMKGLDSKHSIDDLRKFALKHGISVDDFESGVDKALTIQNNKLQLSYEKYSLPVGFNMSLLVLVVVFNALVFVGVIKNGIGGLTGNLIELGRDRVPAEPVFVLPAEAAPFSSILQVKSESVVGETVFYEGEILKGEFTVLKGDWVYAVDEHFKVLEILPVFEGAEAPLGYKVGTRLGLERVAFLVETDSLAAKNKQALDLEAIGVENQPLIVITDHDESLTARNREILATIYRDSLGSTDPLYVYDSQLNLINAAKIKYLIDSSRNSVEQVHAGSQVELVLEFARDYSTKSAYLSTVKDLNLFKDYLRLMDL